MIGKENSSGGGVSGHNIYDHIISRENLFAAWREFQKGKLKKKDVLLYSRNFEEYILKLREKLVSFVYEHGTYSSFFICDPKRRYIHKALMNDRVVHRAIYRILEKIFDKTFIYDSYSSRKGKGVYKAIDRFKEFAQKLSQDNTKRVWVLKCDVRKYFDSIDHDILFKIISSKIKDQKALWLIRIIIDSFNKEKIKSLPLGNVTSQIFSNIYLNEFDQFIKRKLQIKYYIRYADDFVFLSRDKEYLQNLVSVIQKFLSEKLKLELHPNKLFIKTFSSGVDFLGWVHFLDYRVLRTVTKKRILKRVSKKNISSYLGLLKHGNTIKIRNSIDLRQNDGG